MAAVKTLQHGAAGGSANGAAGGAANATANATAANATAAKMNKIALAWYKYKWYYFFVLPAFACFVLFTYIPYGGLTMAFQDYKFFNPAISPWVGFKHFANFFGSRDFPRLMRNTLVISTLRLICGMPIPIIFALLLNEVRVSWYKRTIQTITYFPNFLSWVIYAGIMMTLLAPSGVINYIAKGMGMTPPNFLVSNSTFVPVLIVTDILKGFGFGAIVYLAALSGVDAQLYEAAAIDGAGKWRQTWHITLPGIRPVIVVMFILALGGILNAGFDQIFNMYNSSVIESSDILDTYVYRIGFSGQQYSVGTAVGLFKGVIGFALITAANYTIRRLGEASIW